jgi:hypothetical protein
MSNVTPHLVAARTPRAAMGAWVPGWTFLMRSGDAIWAEASGGWAQAPWDTGPVPFTIDTMAHIGSMSKPLAATGFMALMDDWNWLYSGLKALPPIQFNPTPPPPLPFTPPQTKYVVPDVLAPAFSNQAVAQQLLQRNIPSRIGGGWGAALSWFAQSGQYGNTTLTVPEQPPVAYASMMDRVLTINHALSPDNAFSPLILDSLETAANNLGVPLQLGANIAPKLNPSLPPPHGYYPGITIRQLLTHTSPLRNTDTAAADAYNSQPCSTSTTALPVATFDLWSYLVLYLKQDADQPSGYRDNNYRVVGAVITACTGMVYNDWALARLFYDTRFNQIRRKPLDLTTAARYYSTPALDSTGKLPNDVQYEGWLGDYTAWTADGGWYATARQITDWMFALYSSQPVAQPNGVRPLLSASSVASLFSTADKFFCGGTYDALDAGQVNSFRHNGELGWCNVGSNGKLSVLIGPNGEVHTAFLNVNTGFLSSPLPPGAPAGVDDMFGSVVNDLIALF